MNIKNNYFFKSFEGIQLVYNEYWDFNLIPDKLGDCFGYATECRNSTGYTIVDDKLVTWFDIGNDKTTINGSNLKSLVIWSGLTITPSSGFTLNDWGLTGVDNGRTDCLSGKTLTITSADTKLILYPVTGLTITYDSTSGCTVSSSNYQYPWAFHSGTTVEECFVGDTICLNGGFYQGFFKLDTLKPAPELNTTINECDITASTLTSVSATTFWQIMPTEFKDGWTMETWVNPNNSFCSGSTGNTLNELYPNNKNFFFYIGTRSENKFYNDFSGETGLKTSKGIPLSLTETLNFNQYVKKPNSGVDWVLNEFTTLDCTCTCKGCGITTTNTYDSSIITGGQNWLSNGSTSLDGCCEFCLTGDTITTVVTGRTYSYCDVLSENALGFRITDDGRIGYRKMTVTGTCLNDKYKITGTVMEEGYSEPNIIPKTGNTWTHIAITYTAGSGIKNTLPSGTLRFWVNGLVKYKVNDFIGLQLRALDEWSDKQIGVPFNMSWGGGTQGLLESQTFNGPDYNDRNLLLESNFAGTFEGELSQLRFYEKPLDVLEIRNNFFIDCGRYCRPDNFGGSLTIQPNSEYCVNCESNPIKKVVIGDSTELGIHISAVYLHGSVVCNFTATTTDILTKNTEIPFLNNVYFNDGTYEQINSTILIEAGKNYGTKSITLNRNYSDLSGIYEINNLAISGYDKINLTSNITLNPTVTPLPPPPPPPPPPAIINSVYYGKLITSNFISTGITSFNKIDVNDGRNMFVTLPLGTGYGYILISKNINQPVLFRNSNEGCAGFIVPMINLGTTNIIDANGNTVIYNIYRTFVSTRANVDIWLCD
jgi:hypothetical protein